MTMPSGSPKAPVVRNLTTMVTATRWGTTSIGLLYAATINHDSITTMVLGLVLLANAIFRTLRPIEMESFEYRTGSAPQLLAVLAEVTLGVAIVVATGYWSSPYVFVLFTPVMAAGFVKGTKPSVALAVATIAVVQTMAMTMSQTATRQTFATISAELLLIACVASYARHLLSRVADARADHMATLTQTHRLLVHLNRLSEEIPASFDLQETIDTAMKRVRSDAGTETSVLMLSDTTNGTWTVAFAEGVRLAPALANEELPTRLRQLLRSGSKAHRVELAEGEGLAPTSRTGIYIPLLADSSTVGVIALESPRSFELETSALSAIKETADSAALTIENARWFERLRSRGAAQERVRIARDLHDRVGQGVAYIAFELERLNTAPGDISSDLKQLQVDAKRIVGELRETLYDLRTEVSHEHSLGVTVEAFAERVAARSGISIVVDMPEVVYLSIPQQREAWRIIQESIVNAERHADADNIAVTIASQQSGTEIIIDDDGTGIPDSATAGVAGPGRASYGITGMRERASLLGARLSVSQRQPNGTRVALKLGKIDSARRSEEQMAGDTND